VWEIRDESADANNKPSLASAPPAGLTLNNLSRWDGRDVFLLNVTANTTVNATMHTVNFDAVNRTPDLQVVLWDADFNRVTWSFLFDPDERIDALLVLPGTYYLDIFPASQAYFVTQQMQFDYWLNVTIDPPPRWVDPSFALTTAEDTPGAIDLAALVAPEPAGEALAFRVMGVSGSISATMGVDGHTVSVVPAPDWSGSASVTIEGRDRWSAVTFVVPVNVTPVNDPPRLLPGDPGISINEDTPAIFALSSAVYDPDGDSMTLVGFNATATLNVSFDGVSSAGQLEYRYRSGRIYLELGREYDALFAYKMAISSGTNSKEYYACAAALHAGQLYEQNGEFENAALYYQICLGMNPDSYRSGLHQKAKAGISRLKSQ